MSKKNKGRNTDETNESVGNIQKHNMYNQKEKEAIFQEVAMNLENKENDKNKRKRKRKNHRILKFVLTVIFIGLVTLSILFVM